MRSGKASRYDGIDGIDDIGHIAFDSNSKSEFLKSNIYERGNFYIIQTEVPNAGYENIKVDINTAS